MRAFIAVEMSDDIKNILAQIESHLKYADADVKWVKPEIVHLTLKFLGEITDKKCEDVKSALDAIAKSTKPFELTLKDIGVFPGIEHPRIIWVGLDRGRVEMTELSGRIDESLSKIAFVKEDRPFSPHLTIGRVRSERNKDKLRNKISSASAGFQIPVVGSHVITSVVLFQSTLTPQGPIYTKLHEAKFTV